MQQLFIWQMAGDLFKIASWLLAYMMVAKAMTRLFVSTEIIFSLLYLGLGFLFVHYDGIVGLTQAYLANYVIYTFVMIIAFNNLFQQKRND